MIDCDVHNSWTSAEVLLDYLDPAFREYLDRGEIPGPRGAFPHAHRPWLHPEGFMRYDAVPPSGVTPGADLPFLAEQLLDRYSIDYAVLTGDESIEVSTLANPYYAQALASAYNDWMIENWLSADPRLRGSLIVAPQNPQLAAAEIRRLGDHPDIVQVLVSSGSQRPYGDPFFHPIWEACSEYDLPFAAHLGGQGGLNSTPIACGPTTFFWETHALLCETGMAHLGSTIAHGVFEKWPNARLILIECGVAWVPPVLWRLDEDFRALRKETPWLRRLPSEYARDHIRLTTQPLEVPNSPQALWPALADIGAQDMLMFASDYPHWDFDDPNFIRLPEDWREAVLDGNARSVYRLPAQEVVDELAG
ncbi:amidohydrolase family protein [Brevibacterium ammoniilyticum]|uniref:Amidohydrolase family protein n=1 Tax=Brevibacterium ammoniilyticum TaxID=1046555 RepID=A0ABP9U5G2_9MICO